ncbi:hypothetical protein XENTR_v10008189 [Xenopus tropicalis]|nr:hypothetical protein XENTR_v10008189 [Xenopus tropicalis]KAE8614498.1 hypothetical protein XENTR_v10008189 [Xenopus tropicalis]
MEARHYGWNMEHRTDKGNQDAHPSDCALDNGRNVFYQYSSMPPHHKGNPRPTVSRGPRITKQIWGWQRTEEGVGKSLCPAIITLKYGFPY